MTTAIAKPLKQKSEFLALRQQAEQQLRETRMKVMEMEATIERLKVVMGEASPRPGPLDGVQELLKATADLRIASGNLSAAAVAKVYGVSISQLADWLGSSRQAVTKTPDANSLQNGLGFYERVARLRALVPKDGFVKWLRMPNAQLDGKRPLEILAAGQGQVVADLVDDMLTGAPA